MLLQLLRIQGGYGGRFTMMVDELLRDHAAERHIVIVLAGNDIGTVEKQGSGPWVLDSLRGMFACGRLARFAIASEPLNTLPSQL